MSGREMTRKRMVLFLQLPALDNDVHGAHENIPLALLGWAAGCAVVWSGLFTVGNFLYGRTAMALVLLGIFVLGSLVLLGVISRLWSARSEPR